MQAGWTPDGLIAQLLAPQPRPGTYVDMDEGDILALCGAARRIFAEQPVLLELSSPVKLCGDLHGQYHDLLRIFETAGFPPEESYLFLGDYVDRGRQSLETICLLLAFKVRFPDNFFLLRGNHEEASINRIYGFYDECRRRYSVKMWKTFIDVFNYMPIAGLIETKIFCMHGGIPNIDKLQERFTFQRIRDLKRPIVKVDSGATDEQNIVNDLLWADPAAQGSYLNPGQIVRRYEFNDIRKTSYIFGSAVMSEFMNEHNIDLIARAHEVVDDGYRFFGSPERPKGCITVFSAPNYTGEYENAAAILSIDENLCASITVLAPPNRMQPLEDQDRKA